MDAYTKLFYISVSTSIFHSYELNKNLGWTKFSLHILVFKKQSVPVWVPMSGSEALVGSLGSGAGWTDTTARHRHFQRAKSSGAGTLVKHWNQPLAPWRVPGDAMPTWRITGREEGEQQPSGDVQGGKIHDGVWIMFLLPASTPWVKLIITRILNRYLLWTEDSYCFPCGDEDVHHSAATSNTNPFGGQA